MPEVVLYHLEGRRPLPFPALQCVRRMRVTQPMGAGRPQLLRIGAIEPVGRPREERLDRLVQP